MLVSSYIADKKNARALVASVAALAGGAGYLASGLLPATAYTVSGNNFAAHDDCRLCRTFR